MATNRYFHMSQGLRGCYMPDLSSVIACKTRRELKDALAFDVESYHDAGFIGGSKRAVAQFAAEMWREAAKKNPAYLPLCLPFAHKPTVGKTPNYSHGIFLSVATRRDYLAYVKENEFN
jgi:hypothetical protein